MMENTYGIGVTNRYALFLDDDADPLEVLKVREQEKDARKKAKAAIGGENIKGKSSDVVTKSGAKLTNLNQQQRKTTVKDNASKDIKRDDNKTTGSKPQQQPLQATTATEISNRNENNQRNKYNQQNSNSSASATTSMMTLENNREERNNRRNREERAFNNGPPQGADGQRDERQRREYGNSDVQSGEHRNRGGRGAGGGGGGAGSGGAGGALNRARGGRGGGGGGGGGRGYDQRGKREFDRQSGSDKTHGFSGVKSVDKREGGGPHNWGSHKDIIEEVDKSNNSDVDPSWGDLEKPETVAGVPATEAKEPGTGGGTEGGDSSAPVQEEEPKQFTLDEWRAQRGNRQKPQYNLRKAGEGEDPSQWKKMYELNKKKEGDEEESEEEEYDASEYPQRVGRQKHILDIDIHFNDSRRGGVGGRGRGNRSGPRGPRGGGPGGLGGGERAGGGERDRGERGERGDRGGEPRGEQRGGERGERGERDRGGRAEREPRGGRPFRGGGAPGVERGAAVPAATVADAEADEHIPRSEQQHQQQTQQQHASNKSSAGGAAIAGGRQQNAPKVDDEHDFPSLS